MPRKTINIQFPVLGVVRRSGLRAVSDPGGPYPAVWATNVRLEDALTNRLRGGSFAGIAASTTTADRYVYLVTENGDNIVTENGDKIVLGPQSCVVAWNGWAWRAPGSSAPTASSGDCLYRDRLLRIDGNVILASRMDDTGDWNFSKDISDTMRPTFFQLSEAGEVGADVVTLVPHKDAFLLGFTASTTWVLKGDPTTGSLRNVSREVGIIAPRAWCKNHDMVYFLSSRGLYSVNADGSGLRAVSADKIPVDLEDVTDATCVLDYNHEDRGVYINRTGSTLDWFYDVERDQFWPFLTSTGDSHVLIGPFPLGEKDTYGRVLKLHGVIASGSADVDWRLVTGDTAEDAAANGKAAIEAAVAGTSYATYVASEGTWSAGRNNMAYPRIRAVWCCLWLHSQGSWAYEGASLEAMVSGKWR
jgi:hypothetical protein